MANKLIHETSPYLLQHVDNPVNWYPWGKEALNLARENNKLILVSIGYSACHWCHVMAHESFEDPATAELMNRFYVNVKIDREERPDLDHIYMDAVQAMTGSGGWPLNVFLTNDLKPFYGGTYFPPVPAHGRPSWKEVLMALQEKWINQPQEILEQARSLFEYMEKTATRPPSILPGKENLEEGSMKVIGENLLKTADKTRGGFGNAPKFPQTFSIALLLDHHYFFDDKDALDHACLSLEKMLQGGIYDHIGGGLARYSTDAGWHVPHFEKMLYDNALLLSVLADAYQVTSREVFATAIHHIISFCNRELKSPEGGFYAALDADSEGVEGKFYVWQAAEIIEVLGEEDGKLYNSIYNITAAGNWEGTNIPYLSHELDFLAHELGMEAADLKMKVREWNEKLWSARNKRVHPGLDDKIMLGWNALYLNALARCSLVLGNSTYQEQAVNLHHFLTKTLQNNGQWFHTYKSGKLTIEAFLDDYAYLIQALLSLYTLTGQETFVDEAMALQRECIQKFNDEEDLYFFYTPEGQEDVIIRRLDLYDGALPSANSIMAMNLITISILRPEGSFLERAEKMVGNLRDGIINYPGSFGVWARLMLHLHFGINQIKVKYDSSHLSSIFSELNYIPNKVIEYYAAGNKMEGYQVCKNFVCYPVLIKFEDLKNFVKNLEGKY